MDGSGFPMMPFWVGTVDASKTSGDKPPGMYKNPLFLLMNTFTNLNWFSRRISGCHQQ